MEHVTSLNRSRRFYELDLLRFVAAFEIMMFHYTLYGFRNGHHSFDFTALGGALEYFYFGLELLFMLSGFVILKTVQTKTAMGFLTARAIRLYPTYWVCVTVTAVVLWAANHSSLAVDLPQYLANLTMIQTPLGFEHVDGVYWTLEVQLLFYGWVFLVCLVKQIHNTARLLGVWLVASVMINLFGGLTFTKLDYLLLPGLSFYFIAGAAFFLIYQRGRSLYLGSLIVVCYVMAIRLALLDPRHGNIAAAVVGNTLLFLLFARMVLHDHRLEGRPWILTLFKMTYPLYLMHQNIGYVVLTKLDGVLPKYVALSVAIALMLLGSYVIATQVDNWVTPPLKNAADRLLRAAKKPRVVAPVQHAPAEVAVSAAANANGPQTRAQPAAETVQS
jgi:peptidoglycan/LPS O-acetylase OafA/YrhL